MLAEIPELVDRAKRGLIFSGALPGSALPQYDSNEPFTPHPIPHALRLMARGLWLMAYGLWLVARGSWLVARGSMLMSGVRCQVSGN